jgi:hypothetical protein
MFDPTFTNLIFAISSLIAALTGAVSVGQNAWMLYRNNKEAIASKGRGDGIAAQITRVDTKVEAVAENTNGHMTTLIAAVAPVDPALAVATMVKIQTVAETVREKLEKNDTPEPPAHGK